MHPLITLALAATAVTAVAACDAAMSPVVAGVGNGTSGAGDTTSLIISPPSLQLSVGGTAQLSTNATVAQQAQLQWLSLQPVIVAVTQAGQITARSLGTATIRVRYSFDTTRAATATITVTP